MSGEMIIKKLSDETTVKIGHFQEKKVSVNFQTGNSRTSRIDHYEFIKEQDGKQKKTKISKRLYVALRAFEIDPKF